VQYKYNALGQRVSKTTPTSTTVFHYDQTGQLIGEKNGTNTTDYIYLNTIPVAIGKSSTPQLYYINTDQLNTPRVITNETGTTPCQWDGEAFGNTPPNENPSGAGNFTFNLRFPGQYFDVETNLNQNYFRDYDPAIGRYIESDPIGLYGGSFSTYGYVGGNPLNYSDPLGLFNPAKGISAAGNSVIAGFSAASGGVKVAIATGLSPATLTGVGALPLAVLAGWGAWNLKASQAAWKRVQQQWDEAQCEKWDDSRWKNLWGMAPGGTNYDDPNEPDGPWVYIKSEGWWKFISEAGYF
jgi:RHS repeat-associated protein